MLWKISALIILQFNIEREDHNLKTTFESWYETTCNRNMVKAKKAAIGAIGIASLSPMLVGLGEDAPPEVSLPNNKECDASACDTFYCG